LLGHQVETGNLRARQIGEFTGDARKPGNCRALRECVFSRQEAATI
jgi:hypothetical protein